MWQPISTAPRDGTWILVTGVNQHGSVVQTARWADDGFCKFWQRDDPSRTLAVCGAHHWRHR
jgi:hypothetical protein